MANGIFCFEGDWSERLSNQMTVEPILKLLADCRYAKYVHRNVSTRDSLQHYLDRWLKADMKQYVIGSFAFHGSNGGLWLNANEEITLRELGDMMAGRCEGRILYFGSCSTLAVPDVNLKELCRVTGARGVVGYTRMVDFVESAAFEIILLNDLLQATNIRSSYTRLRRNHDHLTRKLGLRMAHAQWASDRKIARDVIISGT